MPRPSSRAKQRPIETADIKQGRITAKHTRHLADAAMKYITAQARAGIPQHDIITGLAITIASVVLNAAFPHGRTAALDAYAAAVTRCAEHARTKAAPTERMN